MKNLNFANLNKTDICYINGFLYYKEEHLKRSVEWKYRCKLNVYETALVNVKQVHPVYFTQCSICMFKIIQERNRMDAFLNYINFFQDSRVLQNGRFNYCSNYIM